MMDEYDFDILKRDLEKKKLSCLGCGDEIYTDRLHRFCARCSNKNSFRRERPVARNIDSLLTKSNYDVFEEIGE